MKTANDQKGFILPTILAFLFILIVLGGSIIMISLQTQTQALRHSYVQIAHIASKAAIDYAEEQYELDSSYNGTAEQDLFVTDRYRVTIEVDILYNETSTSKRVQAYGRVYIPEYNAAAQFVRDIKASIIRNGEVVADIDPEDFDPVVWLDANYTESLTKYSPPNEQSITALYGSANQDIVEEGGSNASTSSNRGRLDFSGDDLEMSWDGSSLGNQKIGLRFRGLNVNKNDVIEEAYIQFQTDETKTAGAVQLLVQGVASDNASGFSGNYAVTNATKTTASVTWTPPNWNVVGSTSANERVNVTNIVQEIVNRNGWTSGNNIAFSISWVTGSGVRTAEKGQNPGNPVLYVRRPASGSSNFASTNGDQIDTWLDRSLNGNNAVFTYGSRPTLATNQVNGLNAVRFSASGALRGVINGSTTGTAMTAFMVAKPSTSSSSSARYFTFMNTSQSSDSNTYDGVIPFMQQSTSSTMNNYYRNQTGESSSNAINNTWRVYSSRISNSGAGSVERLLVNGAENYSETISNISYNLNEYLVGGTRSSSSGANYANYDVAELIFYNKSLSCDEMQGIENNLGAKYGITIQDKTC